MVQYTEWRSISDGSIISDIPDSVVEYLDIYYPMDEADGTIVGDNLDTFGLDSTWSPETWQVDSGLWEGAGLDMNNEDDVWSSNSTVSITSAVSFCIWFEIQDESDPNVIGVSDDPSASDDNNEIGLRQQSGRGVDIVLSDDGSSGSGDEQTVTNEDERIFAGLSYDDTDNVELHVWDETEKQVTHSETASPNPLPFDGNIFGGQRGTSFYNGVTDFAGVAIDSFLDGDDYEDIWNDTKPN